MCVELTCIHFIYGAIYITNWFCLYKFLYHLLCRFDTWYRFVYNLTRFYVLSWISILLFSFRIVDNIIIPDLESNFEIILLLLSDDNMTRLICEFDLERLNLFAIIWHLHFKWMNSRCNRLVFKYKYFSIGVEKKYIWIAIYRNFLATITKPLLKSACVNNINECHVNHET